MDSNWSGRQITVGPGGTAGSEIHVYYTETDAINLAAGNHKWPDNKNDWTPTRRGYDNPHPCECP